LATTGDALDEIISAIGDAAFPACAGRALAALAGFDLVAIVAHRPGRPSAILFDDFDRLGCRGGVERYASSTYRISPMLGSGAAGMRRSGVWRASDFRGAFAPDRATDDLVTAPDEELGYRTIGWPVRHEEIGLWADDGRTVIEIGLYRERAAKAASPRTLEMLAALRRPVTAAFRRHAALKAALAGRTRTMPAPIAARLTPREREVAELLLRGCSSDAVALRLSISRHTVKDHRKHIFARLGISSLAELFALAA
jgi:DNA-binding CsgD family transcriptional regulator